MKFNARQDIEAPLDFVFAALSDFEAWERAGMRRGADVARTDKLTRTGPGMTWAIKFRYRGKDRSLQIRLDRIDPPGHLGFSATAAPVDGVLALDLMDMAARRTRVHVAMEIKPRTLAARLYVQSLKLARGRADRAFQQRIGQLASEIEDRFKRQPR